MLHVRKNIFQHKANLKKLFLSSPREAKTIHNQEKNFLWSFDSSLSLH